MQKLGVTEKQQNPAVFILGNIQLVEEQFVR
jgi:hypothetical protein